MKKRDSRNDVLNEQLHVVARSFQGFLPKLRGNLALFPHTYCEIAAEHAELFSIQINLQAGMFLTMTSHGWRLPRRNVIVRSFRGFLPKLRGNLIGTSRRLLLAVRFIMVKVYPAPRNDERFV